MVRNGLILHLDAANVKSYPRSGTNWIDMAGGKVCVLNNPTFNTNNGGYFAYNGTSDTGTISSLSISGLTGITVNVWYFSNTTNGTALIRATGNPFILHYRGAGFYLIGNDATASGYLGWQSPPVSSQWTMLTGTWNGTTMCLYQNGVKQSTELAFNGGANGILSTITSINLGYYFNVSQVYTNGNISNAQLYNRALSAAEIQQNFESLRGRYGI